MLQGLVLWRASYSSIHMFFTPSFLFLFITIALFYSLSLSLWVKIICFMLLCFHIYRFDLAVWMLTEELFVHDLWNNIYMFILFSLQMISSCCFLYAMRYLKLISFTVGESLTVSDNTTKLVPLKTLRHTLPLAGAYLLYMVCIS